jgi:antitoxin component YwqK of YwqJK toxin-antitoxin module
MNVQAVGVSKGARRILHVMTDDGRLEEEVRRYDGGGLKYTGVRLDGEMHGEWTWYRLDGSLMRTGAFDRGRQVGVWRTYDRDGAVVKETTFPAPTS